MRTKETNPYAIATAEKINRDIQKIFHERMKELGLSQQTLGEKMGKSRSNIAVLLSQKNVMSLTSIIDFCVNLELDFRILFEKEVKTRVQVSKVESSDK